VLSPARNLIFGGKVCNVFRQHPKLHSTYCLFGEAMISIHLIWREGM
jgi:hypothetical protein